MSKQLQDKVAAVFAAGGAIASAVAHELGSHGAHVFISGRESSSLAATAAKLEASGARVSLAEVDATDDAAVARWLDAVHAEAGRLDIVFNGIGGRPADLRYPADSREQSLEDFLVPLRRIVGSTFVTSRHAARKMSAGGSIVTLSATLSSMTPRAMAGITATCGAVEALTRALAGDFAPDGIRVNCVRGSAMPETRTIQETGAGLAALGYEPQISLPPLGRPITVQDTARTAAFLASDAASGLTGQVITVCAGAFVG